MNYDHSIREAVESGTKSKKNLFDTSVKSELISRLILIQPWQKPRWGQMNVLQMLDHCSLALETAISLSIGHISHEPCPEVDDASKFWEENKLTTRRNEMTLDRMTKLVNLIKYFDSTHMPHRDYRFLGSMMYNEFGEIQFLHIDYHLTQFGK